MTIGVLIPTRNAGRQLRRCILPLLDFKRNLKILVIDSESQDETRQIARSMGVEVKAIRFDEFNHGATRERGRRELGTDIVVMLTQDAYLSDPSMLEALISPLECGEAVVSYARQIPHEGADFFESFPRRFNYPVQSHIRSIDDIDRYGVYTFFCSNSCAAYLNAALDEVGGFGEVLTNEDYFAVAKLLQSGYKVAYVAEAQVMHSHRYTLIEEFKRYFDTGYVRADQSWVNEIVGPAESRGIEFLTLMIQALAISRPWLLPYAVLQTVAKWIGFRIGYWSLNTPTAWKKLMSGQKAYWNRERTMRETRLKPGC